MKAVILAGGYVKRLQSLISNASKSLLPICSEPIISYIMKNCKTSSLIDENGEIVCVTGTKPYAPTMDRYRKIKPMVFDFIDRTKLGKDGEIWLADSIKLMEEGWTQSLWTFI
jgi:NDP-sugar pyrophosphorylase family protein